MVKSFNLLATIEMQTIEKDTTVQVEKHPSAIVHVWKESNDVGCYRSRCKESFPGWKVCYYSRLSDVAYMVRVTKHQDQRVVVSIARWILHCSLQSLRRDQP
mgnify:CR=1 FL=1